jgi:hypothetical protein
MSLLLIDTHVRHHGLIRGAAKVSVVLFNSATDTLAEIGARIAALGVTKFTNIGIVQDGNNMTNSYSLVVTQSAGCSLQDPELKTWGDILNFFTSLKAYDVNAIDFISCLLYSNPGWVSTIASLEARTGINFRASSDFTGNLSAGGNWIQESDGINIQDIYFTAAIANYTQLLYATPYKKSSEMITPAIVVNPHAFVRAGISSNSVVTWGHPEFGGNSSGVSGELLSGVTAIASTDGAFAAIKSDGKVVTWGDPEFGGNSSGVSGELTSGVTAIASTDQAFAAIKSGGRVVTWGNSSYGSDSSGVSGELLSGVTAIASTDLAFAAIKSDGKVVTWGHPLYGGNSSGVSGELLYGVTAIVSTNYAFAAIKSDGKVVTWGYSIWGGNSSGVSGELLSGVTAIASSASSFAALKTDGKVVTWGYREYGGDSSGVSGELLSGVTAIASAGGAFSALKTDGKVVTWGYPAHGGDSSGVSGELLYGVTKVASTFYDFAAIKSDGKVVTWGRPEYGGDSSGVSGELTTGVTAIASTVHGFAAIKSGGKVVTWGDSGFGGDSSGVSGELLSGVTAIVSTNYAFAASKPGGKVVTWGNPLYGGDSRGVSVELSSGVTSIASSHLAFAAMRSIDATTPPTQNLPCFPTGTRVLTAAGYKAVETLQKTDRIITPDGRPLPFNLFSIVIEKTTEATAPYFIPKGTIGNKEDITLSPRHAIQSDKDVWQIPSNAAKRFPSIRQVNIGERVEYFHLELPNFFSDNIVAEGTVVESFAAKQTQGVKIIYKYSEALKGFTRISPAVVTRSTSLF